MTLLSDADAAEPEGPRIKRWIDRVRDLDPDKAGQIDTLIDDWWKGLRRDKFPSVSSLARFVHKYDVGVTVQEIGKYVKAREAKS